MVHIGVIGCSWNLEFSIWIFVVGNYLAYAEFPIVNESNSFHVAMLLWSVSWSWWCAFDACSSYIPVGFIVNLITAFHHSLMQRRAHFNEHMLPRYIPQLPWHQFRLNFALTLTWNCHQHAVPSHCWLSFTVDEINPFPYDKSGPNLDKLCKLGIFLSHSRPHFLFIHCIKCN